MQFDKTKKSRIRRKYRARRKIFGTSERPRMSVFRSGRHIYVQVVDDRAGATLASASSLSKHLSAEVGYGGNIKAAEVVGTAIAKQSLGVGIKCVVFDRSGYKYHGRIKSLADAARKAGLVF